MGLSTQTYCLLKRRGSLKYYEDRRMLLVRIMNHGLIPTE
nr:MAG TPA: hypothetical protein [Caudoviricetes sp.]